MFSNIWDEQGTWETFMVHATCENGEVGRGDYQTVMKQEVVFHLCKIMLFSISIFTLLNSVLRGQFCLQLICLLVIQFVYVADLFKQPKLSLIDKKKFVFNLWYFLTRRENKFQSTITLVIGIYQRIL